MRVSSVSHGLLLRIVLTLFAASVVATAVDIGGRLAIAREARNRDGANLEVADEALLGELTAEFAGRFLLWGLLPKLLLLLVVVLIVARLVRQTLREQMRERRESEANLASSLEEKNILLQEIHHRVKNNLQMVVSLLSLQRRSIANREAQDALRDSENRVTSMSLVHELLYRADRYTDIDLASYMQDLAGTIVYQSQTGACKVSVNYQVETLFVDLGVAIPLGLIVNELLINSMKHAFAGRETGAISISTTRDPETGRTTVSVCDDGQGLPEDWLEARKDSLGLQIVDALCSQIKAELTVASHPGTTCFTLSLTVKETPILEQI